MIPLWIVIAIVSLLSPVPSAAQSQKKKKPRSTSFIIDSLFHHAIANHTFPGAVAAISVGDTIRFFKAYGKMTYDSSATEIEVRTPYDLASLTKALVTTSVLMCLFDEGRWQLSDTVGKFLPEASCFQKGTVTLYHLLTHTSGIVAFRRYHDSLDTPEKVWQAIARDSLVGAKGQNTIYSDVNFVILGKIAETIGGASLDSLFSRYVSNRLNLDHALFFNPNEIQRRLIPPTPEDSLWNMKWARPAVHDPTAARLGGVAGNAGLFGTAEGVIRLAKQFLPPQFHASSTTLFSEKTRALFTRRDTVKSERALGWDMKSPGEKSAAGQFFSSLTFGHLGYTGTSVWIDPEIGACVVLLTNRVYPKESNNAIRAFRRTFQDAAFELISASTPSSPVLKKRKKVRNKS